MFRSGVTVTKQRVHVGLVRQISTLFTWLDGTDLTYDKWSSVRNMKKYVVVLLDIDDNDTYGLWKTIINTRLAIVLCQNSISSNGKFREVAIRVMFKYHSINML